MKVNQLIAMGCISLLSFASCDKDDEGSNNSTTMLNQNDKDYMTNMTYANMAEVQTGNIAKQKAMNTAITNFGSMMVNDHGAAHNQLQEIASSKSMSLPTDTDEEHKQKANMLMNLTGRAFDSTYIHMMVADHDKAIALQQTEITNGQNQDVKNYASSKLPVLQMHRRMADSLANALYP